VGRDWELLVSPEGAPIQWHGALRCRCIGGGCAKRGARLPPCSESSRQKGRRMAIRTLDIATFDHCLLSAVSTWGSDVALACQVMKLASYCSIRWQKKYLWNFVTVRSSFLVAFPQGNYGVASSGVALRFHFFKAMKNQCWKNGAHDANLGTMPAVQMPSLDKSGPWDQIIFRSGDQMIPYMNTRTILYFTKLLITDNDSFTNTTPLKRWIDTAKSFHGEHWGLCAWISCS
jgi:hypothetical protein